MKLNNEFATYPVDDKLVLVGTGGCQFKGMVKANTTAAFIISCLKEETTEEQIVDKMEEKYDAERQVIAADVHQILQKLASIGAITD